MSRTKHARPRKVANRQKGWAIWDARFETWATEVSAQTGFHAVVIHRTKRHAEIAKRALGGRDYVVVSVEVRP